MEGALAAWEGAAWEGATPRDTALATRCEALVDAMSMLASEAALLRAAKAGEEAGGVERAGLAEEALVERRSYLRRLLVHTTLAAVAVSLVLPLVVVAYYLLMPLLGGA